MKRDSLISWSLALFAALVVLAAGFASDVSLGDESYHYRFAGLFFSAERPVFDEIYAHVSHLGYNFTDAVLWHAGLAAVWKAAGGVSAGAAQVYQVMFLLLLFIALYGLGRQVYDERTAAAGLAFSAACPAVVVYSIVLYQDVPLTALAAATLYLIARGRYLPAGAAGGLMLLTKLNGFFFLPGLLCGILLNTTGLRARLLGILKFLAAALAVNAHDIVFRLQAFHSLYYSRPQFTEPLKETAGYVYSYSPYAVNVNPFFLLKNLGFFIPAAFVWYLAARRFDKRDLIIALPAISYCACAFYFFGHNPDPRYYLPVFPLAALLGAKAVSAREIRGRLTIGIVLALLCAQVAFSAGYLFPRRKLHPELKTAFAYIKAHISRTSVIMYPEENMVLYTGNPIAWGRIFTMPRLFWETDAAGAAEELSRYKIDYIAVKKSKIYDDSRARHLGGYPAGFVARLPGFSFLESVFENGQLRIWKVIKPHG